MAKQNTHRAAGRAVTPISAPTAAARSVGGAAVIGTVLVGSAVTMQGATAATAPAAPAATAASHAAPAAVTAPSAQSTFLSAGSTLFSGVRGERVSALQSSLNDNGAHLAVDGVFGSKTHSAVRSFQSSKGLVVDGRVGPATRAALNGGSTSGSSISSSRPSSTSGSAIVSAARSQIGVGYSWGSSNPSKGLDCSGLTTYAYTQAGKSLPRTSSGQAAGGTRISQSQAQPGDIVHWPGHVGIYAGNNKVIDASGSKQQVVERTIWGSPTFVSYR